MRAKHRRSPRPSSRRPQLHLEPLEPRVLLTTIGVGDWFVYQAGGRTGGLDGPLVRVDVVNDITGVGTAEVMRWSAATNDVADMSGVLNGVDYNGGLPRPLGTVIGNSPWTNVTKIQSLAVNGAGQYFAVNNDTGLGSNVAQLVQINPGNSTLIGAPIDIHYDLDATPPPTLYFNTINALDFDNGNVLWAVGTMVDLDAANPPVAVAGVQLITINTATGEATIRGAFADPAVVIDSIAFQANGTLWGVRGGAELVSINTANAGITSAVNLTDVSNGGAAIAGMSGIDWVAGTLYGYAGGNLYSINTGNGQCTLVGPVGLANVAGLANDPGNTDFIFGIDKDPSGDRLVQIMLHPTKPASPFAIYLSESDAYTEVRMTVVTPRVVNNVTVYDTLYLWNPPNGTTPYLLTDPDGVAHYAPANSGGALLGAYQEVDGNGNPTDRYAAVTTEFPLQAGASALGVFPGGDLIAGLTVAETGPAGHTGDFGSLYLGGTQAGRLIVPGSVENILEGFFFGNTDISGDLRTMIVHTDAGGETTGNYFYPEYSSITVGGTLGDLYVRGSHMYAEMYIAGRAAIPDPLTDNVDWNNMKRQPLLELEGRIPETLPMNAGTTGWGDFFSRSYSPDNLGVDQLSSVSVNPVSTTFTNNAQLQAQFLASESGNITLWGYLDSTLNGETVDWYSFSMEAGQTTTISAYALNVNDPRDGLPFTGGVVTLYGPNNALMATYGYETYEDIGVGSGGTVLKPITFTAQEPGLYYLRVAPANFGPYTLFLDNAEPTTLGGVRVNGTYSPAFTLNAPNMQDVYVVQGNSGAITTDGMALGVNVYAERGSIIDFEADQAGFNPTATPPYAAPFALTASGDVGRAESRLSNLIGSVIAGASTGHTIETNASIQMIKAAGYLNGYLDGTTENFLLGTFAATGNIGCIVSTDTISSGMTIAANSDQDGPPTSIDLIQIGGDWGTAAGPPTFLHGVNGNVRFMNIAGDIYADYGSYIGILNPTVITSPATFADDGGGVMTISPGSRTTGVAPNTVTTPTTITFFTIPVDDAVGGVLANMTISGPASFSAVAGGKVEISNLVLAGTTATDSITFKGGEVDIYNVTGGPIGTFANGTSGDILFGNLTGVTTLTTGGSLGYTEVSAGTRIPGPAAAPAVSDAIFGWYNGTLNGLQLGGVVNLVSAGGSIGDLYFPGTVNSIIANSDRVESASAWDGIRGTIYAGTRIGSIDVGDGLMDDGTSADVGPDGFAGTADDTGIAMAGIFCGGATAAGPDGVFYTSDDVLAIGNVIISRKYEQVGDTQWGLLNGSIIAPGGIGAITGTNGARTTAIMSAGGPLDNNGHDMLSDFRVITGAGTFFNDQLPHDVGTVSFSGPGAEIYRAEIYGNRIGAVLTSKGSLGIVETVITANKALANNAAIGRIEADGPGIIDCTIGANGGWIGTLRGTGISSDLIRNFVKSTDSIKVVTGRHIYANTLDAPRMIDTLTATGNMSANTVNVGGIGKATIAGDMLGNTLTIAGPVTSLTVGGQFYTTLILQGPQVAHLGRMIVTGPIGGVITSAGQIDLIQSLTGAISADITTTPDAINGNIGSVIAAAAFLGNITASGGLALLSANGNVGVDPSDVVLAPDHKPRVIRVGGDLGTLSTGGKAKKGVPVVPMSLYSDVIVDGNLGTLQVAGGLYGDLLINGNVTTLAINGQVGALFNLGGPLVMRGNINVRGSLGALTLAPGSNILSNVTFGGDMAAITVVNGTISGNLTSLYGNIPAITVTGGTIAGNVTANLSIGAVRVTSAKGGPPASITGNLTAQNGSIGSIAITGGNLSGNVAANSFITLLSIHGGNLTGNVNAGADITSVTLASDILNSTIRSGGKIGALSATNITNSLISAAGGIGAFAITGNVTNATVLAGYDVGPDLLPNTPDDLANNADLGPVTIGGAVTNSTLAAGIGPRTGNGLYWPLFDGATWATTPAANRVQVADGSSSILGVSVTGAVVNSHFIADTPPVKPPKGIAAVTVDTGDRGYPLGPGIAPGNVVVLLTGGGVASYNNITGQIILAGTTDKSMLTITNTGGPAPNILVAGQDDARLGSLVAGPGITLGNFDLDGPVGTLTTSAIAAGSTLNLFGGVTSFVNSGVVPSSFTLNAGPIGSLTFAGPITAGSITADKIGSMVVNGAAGAGQVGLGANVTTTIGGISSLSLVGGNFSGNVAVNRGAVGTFSITNGSFRNVANPANVNALRSLGGVTSFSIRGGDFAGVVSTPGAVTTFSVSGVFNGRLRAISGIGTLTAGSMTNAVVASGSKISLVTITGDMTTSYILSGFDTGDDGPAPTDNATDNNRDDAVIDALVRATTVTNPNDVVRGGDILSVTIGGNMVRSAISAAVGPGYDGYIGNSDDLVQGAGTLISAQVGGVIIGSGGKETYGFSAATALGKVLIGKKQPYVPVGNVVNHARIDPAGAPRILAVDAYEDSVRIAFNQPIDVSSIHGLWYDGQPANIQIIASIDNIFGNGDDYAVTNNVAHTITYDAVNDRVTLSLNAKTFLGLNHGTHFLVIVSGTGATAITDATGEALDGEYTYQMPTGDGQPGGNLLFRFELGDVHDTAATATDLTHSDVLPAGTYRPLLMYNEVKAIPGKIGDNPNLVGINRDNDVDVYRVDAVQGDILYVGVSSLFIPTVVQVWTWDGATWVEDAPDSLTGQGYYTEKANETYLVSVCSDFFGVGDITVENSTNGTATGSYTLYLNLFNDHNSNFQAGALQQTVGPVTGFNGIQSVAMNQFPGDLYAVDTATNQLLTLDPTTGAGTVDAAITAGYTNIHALDFNSFGNLYAVGKNPANQIAVFRISTFTGTVSQVHPLTGIVPSDITSIAFDSNDNLYGVNPDNNHLVTINRLTGAVTDVGALLDGVTPIAGVTGIAFSGTDVLYAVAPGKLYTINPATGSALSSAPINYAGLSALTFDWSSSVPSLLAIDSTPAPDTLVRLTPTGDVTQTPTPITWVGNTAKPLMIDANSRNVQVITAPDDVDIYRLDNVPDLTKLDILVKSWSIGSALTPYIALFNANGEQITCIAFPGGTKSGDIGATPQAYVDTPEISAWTPDATPGPGGTATYYVAVWGGDTVSPFVGELHYQLTVTKTEPTQPGYVAPVWEQAAPPTQTVYLNFTGGDEAFLVDEFGPGTNPYVDPFAASVFGFGLPSDTIQMINQITAQVQNLYAGYNITFTTQRPLIGDYTEIKIAGSVAPQVGTYGIAEQIDPLNSDWTDKAVVWAGEMAADYSDALGYTMAQISQVVGGTVAHELGHLLGLNHNTGPVTVPTLLMEPNSSDGPFAFGTGSLVDYLVGYQTDSILLRVIA